MILDSANIIRQKRKTIKVVLTNNGEINLFCPYNLSYAKIENLLEPKYELIRKKIKEIKQNSAKNYDLINYKKILVMGKEYLVEKNNQIKKPCFSDDFFFVPVKYYEADKIAFIIKKTLIELADHMLKTFVIDITNKNESFIPKKIVIGSFRAKWGSCDSLQTIKLNWKLIMLPQNLIDFVIYHELTHLKELNHSTKFYNILKDFAPNHRVERKKLKEYNFLLSLY